MAKSNKLTASEKTDYADLLDIFTHVNCGRVFSFRELGITVAIRPALLADNPRFFKVSVSYCSSADKFSRKRGKFEALLKNMNDEFIIVPANGQAVTAVAVKIANFLG